MNYLVAIVSDRIQAEAAYSALEKEGISPQKMSILGRGYKSADEFGLIDPNRKARQQTRFMATWLIPFGFVMGMTFSLITQLQTFAWAGEIGNHVIGGVLGAISGAMGSFFVGGGVSLLFSGSELPYRNRLNAGKYLIIVEGSEALMQQSQSILKGFNPESLQKHPPLELLNAEILSRK